MSTYEERLQAFYNEQASKIERRANKNFFDRLVLHFTSIGCWDHETPFPFTADLASEYADFVGGKVEPLDHRDYVGFFTVIDEGESTSCACVRDMVDDQFSYEPIEDVDGYPLG